MGATAVPETFASPAGWTIYAISDLHTDFEENMRWVEKLSSVYHPWSVLILAGDVSDDIQLLRYTATAMLRYCAKNLDVNR